METFQEGAIQSARDRRKNEDPEQDIVDHQALAEANPIDIEHPRRKAVATQRKRKYEARRVKKAKELNNKTSRISRKDVMDQSERSSSVVLQEEEEGDNKENNDNDDDEEENAVAEEEEIESEEDDDDEDKSEIEDKVVEREEKAEEEEVQVNSRGRRINAPSRDIVPINQSSTYRRNRWN